MKRVAIINQGYIDNVILVDDDYQIKNDGSELFESDARAANIPYKIVVNDTPVITVEMTQFKLALVNAGLYTAVVDAINEITDPTEKLKTEIWFNNLTARSDHPLVLQFATALGVSNDQVMDIFNDALQIS